MLCFDLYLKNIFAKSMNADRYTDVIFKLPLYYLSVYFYMKHINVLGTHYFVVLNSVSGEE